MSSTSSSKHSATSSTRTFQYSGDLEGEEVTLEVSVIPSIVSCSMRAIRSRAPHKFASCVAQHTKALPFIECASDWSVAASQSCAAWRHDASCAIAPEQKDFDVSITNSQSQSTCSSDINAV